MSNEPVGTTENNTCGEGLRPSPFKPYRQQFGF
jgi:hypothetical protein